jgi:hypothetical protein
VKLTVTIIGIIDTAAMQNLTTTTQTAALKYKRTDEMRGPGLKTTLSNSYNKDYGPYTLTKFDNNYNAGTDYATIPRDTVIQKSMQRTLTDSVEIAIFYGHDSLTYDYDIDVSTQASITGGSSSSLVLTSAMVNFKFEYCTCPKVTLPIGLKNFTVTKTSAQTANLYWEGENDEYAYNYDVEVSRDGRHFTKVATVDRKYTAHPTYLFAHAAGTDYGRYYYRVRQHWLNGYVRYTPVKMAEFTNPLFAATTLYPKPSTGSVGIKFVNVNAGKMLVQIANATGQQVAMKELSVTQNDYQPLAQLPSGLYWVKITDAATKTSCVRQLVVQ